MHGTAELDKNKPTLVFANTADLISVHAGCIFNFSNSVSFYFAPEMCTGNLFALKITNVCHFDMKTNQLYSFLWISYFSIVSWFCSGFSKLTSGLCPDTRQCSIDDVLESNNKLKSQVEQYNCQISPNVEMTSSRKRNILGQQKICL